MSDPTITPNVVISDPSLRKGVGAALYIVSVLTGLATIVILGFPELSSGFDTNRLIGVVNACVSFLTGAFGIVVTLPNVPKR